MFQPEVLGVGAATLDQFLRVPEFPAGEGVTEIEDLWEDGGGPVATALCVLGHLGRNVGLVDSVCEGKAAKKVAASLARHGVSLAPIEPMAGEPARAWIWVRASDGTRHIAYRPAESEEPSPAQLRAEWFERARLLHVNGRHEAAARRAIELAREVGAEVSFDGGAGRFRESIRDLVKVSDHRIVARQFAEAYSGTADLDEAARCLGAGEAETVVITDGLRGSHVWDRAGRHLHQPAVPTKTVDTTGCGDVYHGAFLHGLLEGWPQAKCAAFAADWASRTAAGLGGRCALSS